MSNLTCWRIRREIKRVEAKVRSRLRIPPGHPLSEPPPEPPPWCEHWWTIEDWELHGTHPSRPLDSDDFASDLWDALVDKFVGDHDPSRYMDFHSCFSPPGPGPEHVVSNLGQHALNCHSKGSGHHASASSARSENTGGPLASAAPGSRQSWGLHLKRLSKIVLGPFLVLCCWCTPSRALAHRVLVQTTTSFKCFSGQHASGFPLVVDSGASVCISPCRSDFVTYKPSKAKIKDLSSTNRVEGEGLVRWHVLDADGKSVSVELPAFHIPQAEVRLLSPQLLYDFAGGHGVQTASEYRLILHDGTTLVASNCSRSRLPLLSFARSHRSRNIWNDGFSFPPNTVKVAEAHTNVLSETNANLSPAQKEVLLWHQRLSHASIPWVQALMRDRKWLKTHSSNHSLHQGPFIPCKEARGPVCDISGLKCASCITAKATIRSPGVRCSHLPKPPCALPSDEFRARLDGRREKVLKEGHTKPGDCISADHYISGTQGRLPNTFGRERQGYTCGTLFVDHASGKIFNYCQFSTSAAETVASKHKLEALAAEEGFTIKSYHSDNGIFASSDFKSDCDQLQQSYSFSGVGAHHQNGIAERNIKTVVQWARASMLHAALRWPAQASVVLWPMAIAYAVWVFNRLPQLDSGLCPDEIWSQTRCAHDDFRRAHVFGCPTYVLEPKLQDGKKIPKWHPRARLGMFVGFSPFHSSLVPLILNVRTGWISPQYHVIFDDKFETVESLEDECLESSWGRLLRLPRETFVDLEYDSDGKLKTSILPDLEPGWVPDLDGSRGSSGNCGVKHGAKSRSRRRVKGSDAPRATIKTPSDAGCPLAPPSGDADASGGVCEDSGGVDEGPGGAGPRRSPRLRGLADVSAAKWGQPAAFVANRGRSPSSFHPSCRVDKAFLANRPLARDSWGSGVHPQAFLGCLSRDSWDPSLVGTLSPWALAARSLKYNADNPLWEDIMTGEF